MIGEPTHRFRTEPNGYPLVQIGPGVLTVNTIDSKYSWKEYEAWIIDAFKRLTEIYTLKESQNVRLTLQYIDLIKFDFEKEDVLNFLKEKMNISVNQSFYTESNAKNVVLGLNFENSLGILNVSIVRGKNIKGEDGITIQTNLTSGVIKPEINFVGEWLAKAHELTSGLFKEMTKGKLQEMFASNYYYGKYSRIDRKSDKLKESKTIRTGCLINFYKSDAFQWH